MSEKPLVSIVTPCYNHQNYLNDYFESICSQTYTNVELILFDDASTDKSQDIINEWIPKLKERFVKFTYIPRIKNVGVIRNCNDSLELIQGKYVCFFASDDIMLPEKIEENVSYLEKNKKCGMVYSNIFTLKGMKVSKKPVYSKIMPMGDIFLKLLEKPNFIYAVSVCLRTSALMESGGYDEKQSAEDYQMWLKISEKNEVGYLNKPLAIYRLSENSLCNGSEYKINMMDQVIDLKMSYSGSPKVTEAIMNQVMRKTYKNYAIKSFFYNERVKFEHYRYRYAFLSINNRKSVKLELLSQVAKVPILHKIAIIAAQIYKLRSLSQIRYIINQK